MTNMRRYALALVTLVTLIVPAKAQYDYPGPPMWDRGYDNPEYRRQRRPVPQIRGPGRGPEVDPCIYHGDCMGPKYQDRIPQGYPIPPYPRY